MACSLMEGSVWGRTQGGVLSRSWIEPGSLSVFTGVISTDQQKERKRKGSWEKHVVCVELSRAQDWLAQGCIDHNQLAFFAFHCITLFPSTQAQGQLKPWLFPMGSVSWLFTQLTRSSGGQSDSTVILRVCTMLWV